MFHVKQKYLQKCSKTSCKMKEFVLYYGILFDKEETVWGK